MTPEQGADGPGRGTAHAPGGAELGTVSPPPAGQGTPFNCLPKGKQTLSRNSCRLERSEMRMVGLGEPRAPLH